MPKTFNEEARLSNGSYPSSLERPVQEHLGKTLRAIYQIMAEKPTYLGEPSFPAAFEAQLDRLARRLTAGERGTSAVAKALHSEIPVAKEN